MYMFTDEWSFYLTYTKTLKQKSFFFFFLYIPLGPQSEFRAVFSNCISPFSLSPSVISSLPFLSSWFFSQFLTLYCQKPLLYKHPHYHFIKFLISLVFWHLVEKCMSTMQMGTQMVKLRGGSRGLVRFFYLDEHKSCIRWRPSRKNEKAKSEFLASQPQEVAVAHLLTSVNQHVHQKEKRHYCYSCCFWILINMWGFWQWSISHRRLLWNALLISPVADTNILPGAPMWAKTSDWPLSSERCAIFSCEASRSLWSVPKLLTTIM